MKFITHIYFIMWLTLARSLPFCRNDRMVDASKLPRLFGLKSNKLKVSSPTSIISEVRPFFSESFALQHLSFYSKILSKSVSTESYRQKVFSWVLKHSNKLLIIAKITTSIIGGKICHFIN